MGKPAARMTDMTDKGGPIVQGSATVLIGDAGGKACSVCPGGMTKGSPVNPMLGAKVLVGGEDLDFALPGPMPVVWQRQYSSYVNVEHGATCGLLGYGWKLGFEISVRLEEDCTLLFDAGGRVITFPEALQPGQALRSASEDLWLMRGGGMGLGQTVAALTSTATTNQSGTASASCTVATNAATNTPEELLPWTEQACWSHVPAKLKADPAFVLAASGGSGSGGRTVWAMLPVSVNAPSGSNPPNKATHHLVGLLDQFGRHQQYHYDEHGRVQRIDDGVGRRYVLLYNQDKPQDKPQPTKPPAAASAAPALVGTTPTLLGPDSGLRLTGVDLVHNPLDADHTSALPGRAKPIPLVRYRYNALGDLAEVYGRDGQRTRQFSYDTAHRMVAHRVGMGPGHSYVYEDQTPAAKQTNQALRPGARVVEQHNEEGLSYFFEYRDAAVAPDTASSSTSPPKTQVLVRDSLNRVTHYHFEGSGGDKRLTRVVNPDGSCESYQYNGTGQRLAATDALGRTTYWRYDGLGRLLGIQGPDGKSSHQTWGAVGSAQDGLVLQSTSTSGVLTRYAYDALGRLTEITSAADTDVASTTRLEYVQAQPGQTLAAAVLPWCDQPIALIDAQGGRKTMTYNPAGQMSSYTDCSGKSSRWHFDAWGELVEEVNALSQRVIHQRDLMGRLQQIQRPDGSTVQYRWGGNNEVQAVTVSGVTTNTGTDAANRNTATTTVTYTHDLWGRMTSQTQAGHSLALRYDVAGRLLELINENQAVTRFTYDVQDRLVQEVGFDGRCQSYAYDAAGRLIDKTDSQDSGMAAANQGPGTVRSRYHYDNAGRLVARLMGKVAGNNEAAQLEVHRFTYDDAGDLVRAQSWSAAFDAPTSQRWLQLSSHELQTLLTNPQDESVLEMAQQLQVQQLQASSRVALQRDQLGRTTGETQTLYRLGLLNDKTTNDTTNNTQGQSAPIKSGEPPVEFEHHIAHRLGALGQRQGTQLQGMGQLDWLSYGSGHVHGLLLNQTPLIHLERDSLHREVGRTLHVLADDGMERPAIEQTRELDPLGRLLQQRWQGLAVAGAAGLQNNAASQPLVGGMQGHHASLGKLALRRYSYDGLGQLIGVQTPGDATLYQYDAQQRLIGMTHADPKGERSQRWRLDAAGNRLPETNTQAQRGQTPGQKTDWSAQVQQNLNNPEFDLLKPEGSHTNGSGEVQRWRDNRVHYSTDSNGNTTHYRYDAHGNRVQATSIDGSKMLLHYDALHQLTQVEHVNAQGQVQAISRYRYDAFGRRMAKTHQHITQETPQTHYFGWDGDRLVHTEDSSLIRHTVYEPDSFVPLLQLQQAKGHMTRAQTLWSLGSEDEGDEDQPSHQPQALTAFEGLPREQREMLQGVLEMAMQPGGKALQGLPVNAETAQLLSESVATLKAAHDASAKAHPVTIRHYLTDHLGTPIALVDANGQKAGQVTWAASYNTWGDIKEEFNPHHLQQPIRFQGQQVDAETGLHYNRFRYYDPSLGQYVTQDPIGLEGGFNKILYPSNPTGWVDPMGLNKVGRSAKANTATSQKVKSIENAPNKVKDLYNSMLDKGEEFADAAFDGASEFLKNITGGNDAAKRIDEALVCKKQRNEKTGEISTPMDVIAPDSRNVGVIREPSPSELGPDMRCIDPQLRPMPNQPLPGLEPGKPKLTQKR